MQDSTQKRTKKDLATKIEELEIKLEQLQRTLGRGKIVKQSSTEPLP